MAVWSIIPKETLSSEARWDPEHFRPEFLAQANAIATLPHLPLDAVGKVSDGNHLSIAEEFCDEGVRYLRGQDLSDFFISDTDPIYIPTKHYSLLTRSHMHPGDVLVCIVGANTGQVGLVTDRHGKLTGSCKLGIVRPSSLPSEYVAAYLASTIGQREIISRIRGSGQTGLILPDLKKIPIVKPADGFRDRIVGLVQEGQRARAVVADRLADAEAVLIDALKLARVDLSQSLAFERPFSELLAAKRWGAEYYMPAKYRVLSALSSKPHRRLSEQFSSVNEIFKPENARKQGAVRNFDLSDALNLFIDDSKESMPARSVGSTKKWIRPGDLIVSRLRSYLKEIALVRTSAPAVASTEFVVLRPQRSAIDVRTLAVYLLSPPVQAVLRWSQDGSNHPRFDEAQLLAMPIPEAVADAATFVNDLVDEAILARQRSDSLLAESKAAIDEFVLRAGR